MDEKRSGEGRCSGKDRRKGGTSSSNGSERRSLKFRRSDIDKRDKKE